MSHYATRRTRRERHRQRQAQESLLDNHSSSRVEKEQEHAKELYETSLPGNNAAKFGGVTLSQVSPKHMTNLEYLNPLQYPLAFAQRRCGRRPPKIQDETAMEPDDNDNDNDDEEKEAIAPAVGFRTLQALHQDGSTKTNWVEMAASFGNWAVLFQLLKGGVDVTQSWERSRENDDDWTALSLPVRRLWCNAASPSEEEEEEQMTEFWGLPVGYSCWIVRCVVSMRLLARLEQLWKKDDEENNKTCGICGKDVPLLLSWCGPSSIHPSFCSCRFCEACLWRDILQHMSHRNELLCPLCQCRRPDMPSCFYRDAPETDTATAGGGLDAFATRLDRKQESRRRYQALPLTIQDVPTSMPHKKKKHRLRRSALHNFGRGRCAPSWTSSYTDGTLGSSQDVRSVRFLRASSTRRPSIWMLRHLLREEGVDVDGTVEEYGCTPLMLATLAQDVNAVRELLHYGALVHPLPRRGAAGGYCALDLCRAAKCQPCLPPRQANPMDQIQQLLHEAVLQEDSSIVIPPEDRAWCCNVFEPLRPSSSLKPTILVQPTAWGRSLVVDHWWSEENMRQLEALWNVLPTDGGRKAHASAATTTKGPNGADAVLLQRQVRNNNAARPQKNGHDGLVGASSRSYYHDALGLYCAAMEEHLSRELSPLLQVVAIFRKLRFLHYSQPSSYLAPHTDLSRTQGHHCRSTHTLLLYLYDCQEGGETNLLHQLGGPGGAIAEEEDAWNVSLLGLDHHEEEDGEEEQEEQGESQEREEGEEEKDALPPRDKKTRPDANLVLSVKPRRGRLFLFPHACPHEGAPVVSVPKVVLRGEAYLEWNDSND